MAEQVVDREQTIDYPDGVRVDGQVDEIVRMAAWIGNLSDDETFCSFTSLLLALLFLDTYSGDFARSIDVNRAAMRDHRRIAEAGIEEAHRQAQSGQLPNGKPMFSASARDMLRGSAEIAGTEAVVGAHHLFLAYLFRTPPVHRKQMRAWNFEVAAARQKASTALAGAETRASSTPPPRVPGRFLAIYSFSDGALRVLRTAIDAALRRGAPRNFVGSGTLLAAMIAQCRSAARDENVGLEALNDLLPADLSPDAVGPVAVEQAGSFQVGERLPDLSPNVDAILELADELAQTTRSDAAATIGVRHLLAGLLLHDDTPAPNAHKQLVAAGLDIALMVRRLANAATAWEDRADGWRDITAGHLPGRAIGRERLPAMLGGGMNTAREASETELCLNVDDYAGALAELFSQADNGEFCFAIYGDWGRGKTLLMRRLEEALSRRSAKTYETVYFSAWKYPSAPEVWVHLYETFAKAAFDGARHVAIPRIIRTAIAKRGDRGPLIAYAMLALSVFPLFEALKVATEAAQFVYIALGTTGLVWLWTVARGVRKTGARLSREYLTASRHTEKLGLQATIGTDLRMLLIGWMPERPFSRSFVIGFFGITALFLLGTWLRLTGWAAAETSTTDRFGFPLVTSWRAGTAAGLVGVLLAVLVVAFWWIRRGGSPPARIVLVVDDLDRCGLEHLLSVMESIKLLIEDFEISRRVQVAMLLEEEILKHAIFEKYGGLIDPTKTALLQTSYDVDRLMRENCEKLFTASLRLPRLGKTEVQDLIETFSSRRQKLQAERRAGEAPKEAPRSSPPGDRARGNGIETRGAPARNADAAIDTGAPAEDEQTVVAATAPPAVLRQFDRVKRLFQLIGRDQGGADPGRQIRSVSPDVLSEAEVAAVLAALANDTAQLRGNLGPRSIRAFLFRYQLARLLLTKLEIEWEPEPLARELAEQVLTRREGKTGTAPLPPAPDNPGSEKLRRLVEQVS